MEYVRAGCATLIALIFVVSVVSKFRDLPGFTRSLPALAPVRPDLARPLAVLVVAMETATPLLLVTPPAASYGFALASASRTRCRAQGPIASRMAGSVSSVR
ncbi:MauE/DoxX family redox-associated membrane protein [Sphaerisporangium sp. NPDC088356]|uniref:MauE/DoxX family redox-associated membrane protein n=1 Tax=Sphaerisporangium sp. NPDC088356 TaxID=3154871 RepID=UPI0034211ACF